MDLPNQIIHISNINQLIPIPDLKKYLYAVFHQFGTILDIAAHDSINYRGHAFIAFEHLSSAIEAVKSMKGFVFYGKPLKIKYAKIDSNMTETIVERSKATRSFEDTHYASPGDSSGCTSNFVSGNALVSNIVEVNDTNPGMIIVKVEPGTEAADTTHAENCI